MGSHFHVSRWTPTTSDILKTLKQGFVGSQLDPHEDTKVWLREDGKLVLERPEDLWNHHYKRRRENCRCGFFTVPWEPYKCLGGPLILDSNELLRQTFPTYLDKKGILGNTGAAKGTTLGPRSDIKEKKDESHLSNVHDRVAPIGYCQIRELLKNEDERMVAMQAGLTYMDHIKRIEQRLEDKKEKPINGMVLMSTSDFAFMFAGARESASTNSQSNKAIEAKQQSSTSIESGSSVETSMTSTSSDKSSDSLLRVHSGLRERLDRLRKDNIEFLETIYRLLTIMKNIKYRDIRNKHPLTRSQLKDFENSRRIDRESRVAGVSHLQKRLSTEMTFSTDVSPTNISSQSENKHWHHPGIIPKRKNRLLSMFGPTGPLIAICSRTSAVINNDRISRMMAESSRDMRVETWDDLLRAGETPEGEHDLPVQIIPDTMISKAIKWSRYISGKDINEQSILDEKNKPIWQVVANEKQRNSQFDDSHRNIKSKDPTAICERVRRNMEKVNQTLRESCNEAVKQINKDRIAVFRHKFSTFNDMGGTTLLHKQLSRMREPTEYGNGDPEMPDVIPSKWLEELTDRIYNTIGRDDTEVNSALGQLGQYSQMVVKNISQTKAKLCLIVMSLPAYDICKISTQLAVKFILEKINLVTVDDFYHWLNLRKLPVVIELTNITK